MKPLIPSVLSCLLWGVLSSTALASDELVLGDVARPRISLELRDADVREALRMVARQSDVDIVLGGTVEGPITLKLVDATVAETLDAIMKVSGLQYTEQGKIITVSSMDDLLKQRQLAASLLGPNAQDGSGAPQLTEVRLFKLQYVDAARVQSTLTPLLSDVGSVTLLKTTDHVIQESGAAAKAGGQAAGLQIGGRLTSSSMGQPARSHTLVVSDVPERLERIAELVDELDTKPVQVLIEARFVEVALGKDDRLGIDWNVAIKAAGPNSPHIFPFNNTNLGGSNPNVTGGSQGGLFPAAPLSVTTPGIPGLFTFGTLDLTMFTGLLEMINDDSRVQIVSNPRVTVQDRTTATILVGERYPILSTTVTDQGTVTEELDRYEKIGVQLEVTPSVLNDDEIELFARPSTSTLGPVIKGSTGIEVARINTRQVDTSVTVMDGQTIVLGGLISSRESNTESKVPYLSAIPWLGDWLFSFESKATERVDLVVFLTVTIVREQGLTKSQQALFESTSFDVPDEEGGDSWWTPLEFTPSAPQY